MQVILKNILKQLMQGILKNIPKKDMVWREVEWERNYFYFLPHKKITIYILDQISHLSILGLLLI